MESRFVVMLAKRPTRTLRAVAALFLGLAGSAIYANVVQKAYPVSDWLFWDIIKLWFWLGIFSLGCLSFGCFLLIRLLKIAIEDPIESAALSMAVGVVCFVMAMYVGGAAGQYNATFAGSLPLVMLGVGAFDCVGLIRRLIDDGASTHRSGLSLAISGFGLLFLGLVYLAVLTPDAIGCDATMVHMKIPEEYVRAGRIVPFLANYTATVPHLSSILYTWAYLVPGLLQSQHWEMALHVEFCLFLWTLVGVAAAVRRMVGDRTLAAGWAVIFLFPGFFAGDCYFSGSADHILAFFSVPIALAVLHVGKGFARGPCILLGIVLAGALLTKYQAVYLLVGAGAVVAASWLIQLYSTVREQKSSGRAGRLRRLLWAPVLIVAVLVVLVSPHFVKNLIFYRNPVYPFMLQTFVHSTPTFRNAVVYVDNLYKDTNWVPPGSLFDKLKHAAELFVTFSFKPHYFIKETPFVGSLFTLLLPAAFFVPNRKATARVAAIAAIALFMWAFTFNVDRNLQTFMPVLACVTGALVVKLWRLGLLARMGLVPLVAFQVIWGADEPFYEMGRGRILSAMDLIATGFENRVSTRWDGYRSSYVALTNALPADAKVILHLAHDSLGINRQLWLDRAGFQGFISYQELHTPLEMYAYYRSLGVTHVIQDARETNPAAQQDEILFRLLVLRYAISQGTFGTYHLYELPKSAPPVENAYRVLSLGISGYADGLYPIEKMGTVEYLRPPNKQYSPPQTPANSNNLSELLASADVVLMRSNHSLSEDSRRALYSRFESLTNYGGGCVMYTLRR